MKLGLQFRESLLGLSPTLVAELDQVTEAVRTSYGRQHDAEGRHTAVTATSLTISPSHTRSTPPVDATLEMFPSSHLDNGTTERPGGALLSVTNDRAVQGFDGHLAIDTYRGMHVVNCPRIRYARVTNQSIPDNTMTVVDWETTAFESIEHGFVEASGVITFPEIGGYLCTAQLLVEPNATGVRILDFVHGGVVVARTLGMGDAAIHTGLNLSQILSVPVTTSEFSVRVYQNSGGALTLTGLTHPNLTTVTIVRLW